MCYPNHPPPSPIFSIHNNHFRFARAFLFRLSLSDRLEHHRRHHKYYIIRLLVRRHFWRNIHRVGPPEEPRKNAKRRSTDLGAFDKISTRFGHFCPSQPRFRCRGPCGSLRKRKMIGKHCCLSSNVPSSSCRLLQCRTVGLLPTPPTS